MEHHRGGGGAIPLRRPWVAGGVKPWARIVDRGYKLGLTPVHKALLVANPIEIIRKIQAAENVWGEFIQNGPDDGIGGYVRDRYRDRCNEFANLPGWARALSKPVAGSLSRACQGYWDDQGTDGPVSEPPFTGGQCDCEMYRVDYLIEGTSEQFGNPYTRQGTFKVRGPIGAPVRGSGNNLYVVTAKSIRSGLAGADPACGDVQEVVLATISFAVASANLTTFTVTSLDSNPGDCGDPPEEVNPGPNPPPNPGPFPGPEPTDDPRNPFGPPLVPIPPFNDPVFGPIPIVGDPEPDEPGGGGNPSGGDGLPGNPDAIGDSAGGAGGGADGEDVDFGQPPEGAIWVAALVQAEVDSRLGNIPGTGPEQTVYPTVIGNASLIYAGGRGTNERLESASTLLTRATTALVLTGCRVQAQPGVTLTVRPISALTCPENPCEEQDG